MIDSVLQLRVVYEDIPDLIELGILVKHRGWSSNSTAYTSPATLANCANSLLHWANDPRIPEAVVFGADTGIGSLRLRFYTIDAACHAACAITVATGGSAPEARPEETWRMQIEMATEVGLVERFAHACNGLSKSLKGEATLLGLAV